MIAELSQPPISANQAVRFIFENRFRMKKMNRYGDQNPTKTPYLYGLPRLINGSQVHVVDVRQVCDKEKGSTRPIEM
jgi:hypothetical protein